MIIFVIYDKKKRFAGILSTIEEKKVFLTNWELIYLHNLLAYPLIQGFTESIIFIRFF